MPHLRRNYDAQRKLLQVRGVRINQRVQLEAKAMPSDRTDCQIKNGCGRCREDQNFLTRKRRPPVSHSLTLTAVDLFCGCGGMTLGIREAAARFNANLSVSLAVDNDEDVLSI